MKAGHCLEQLAVAIKMFGTYVNKRQTQVTEFNRKLNKKKKQEEKGAYAFKVLFIPQLER